MKLTIFPGSSLNGETGSDIPGDKSISHRASLFAAIATGESRIENFQVSGVTRPILKALTMLCVPWQLAGFTLMVQGKGLAGLKSPKLPIDCGNSATTLRLLAGAIAGAGISAELDGSSGLRRRPMDRIVDPLRQMGVCINASPAETAPLRLTTRPVESSLTPLHYSIPIASAQVKTCLLLAGLGANGTTILKEPGPSRDHTERMLSSMGVRIISHLENSEQRTQYVVEMTSSKSLELAPLNLHVPGDPSAAAFLIVAALVTPGSCLTLRDICLNPTRIGLLDALTSMGAIFTLSNQQMTGGEPTGDLTVEYAPLHSTEINGLLVVRMIDEFPALAVAAALAQGVTVVHDAAELRLKESDRISVLARELRLLGVNIEERSDGFTIHGGKLHGGCVQSHGDHRLAMSFVVAGLNGETPTTVLGVECIAESFPIFAETLQRLGANLKSED